jgi:YD repeat-containing protein
MISRHYPARRHIGDCDRSARSVFGGVLLLTLVFLLAASAIGHSGTVTYVYDELGRLTGVIDTSGNAATYKYDAVGNLLSIQRTSSSQTSIVGFTPARGLVATTVTIYGTGFSATANQNTVTFNGAATVTSSTTTSIVTAVPSGATTGPIKVTAPSGTATSTSPFTVG